MSATRQISVRLAVEGAEAARRQLEELRKSGEAAGEGMAPKPQQIAAFERLQRSVDPAVAAASRYEQVVRRVQAAEAAGVGTTEQRTRVVEQAAMAHQRATLAVDQHGQATGRFGGIVGQAGFQVQDFVTQVQMGQSALMAFGVQGAQLLGAFGTGGAIAGALLVAGTLGAQFVGLGAAADTLGDAVKAVNDNYTRLNESAERRQNAMQSEARDVSALAAEYVAMGAAAGRAESLIVERQGATLDTEGERLRQSLTGALSASVRQRMSPRDATDPNTGVALGLARPEEGLAGLASALERVQADAGASMQAMREVAAEADRLAQAGGEGASSFRALRDAALDLLPAAGRLDQAQRQLAVQTLASAEAMGAGEGALQRYAERFGALGAEIRQAATALTTLRRINSESPFADIEQDAARTEAQLAALRAGGLDALTATQQRQAVERAGAEANIRIYTQELAALRERGVAQEEAEAQAASAAMAAQRRAEQGVEAAQALTREQRALEQAARDAARAANATPRAGRAGRADPVSVAFEFSDTPGQTVFPAAAIDAANQRIEAEQRRSLDRQEREAEQSAQNISRFLADGFTDAFTDGERGFAGMLESLQRLAIQTPIRIAAEAFITPIAQSAVGAIGGAGGAGGIAELFGFAQAGANARSLLGHGGGEGGGIAGLLRTPIGASMGAEATIGSAIGGVGGGFALGSMIGQFTAGNSRARQTNSQIGAGAGAMAGAAIGSFVPGVGTVIGGLVGGAIGGGGGGLIGPGRAFSGGDALIGVNDNGALSVVGYAGKNFEDSEALLAQAQQQVAALNQVLAGAGLSFARGQGGTDAGAFAAALGGGESGNPRDIVGALGQFGVGGLRSSDARVQGALDRLAGQGGATLQAQLEAATEAGNFADTIDALAQAAKDAEDPIGAIKRSYEEQFEIARRLGFGYEELAAAQQKAIDAAEQQKRQADDTRANAARGILEDLTVGGIGGISPEARATAARLQLSGALGALGDGASNAEIDELRRVSGRALPVIQQVEGITGSFASLVQQVTDAARAAAPGADTANLGGVIDATVSIGDQIADAVNFAGGATVQALRDLQAENQRLNAKLDATLARLAA